MQSKGKTVEAYLAALPADRREALQAVREVILANLDGGYEEGMQYGMIGYYVPHSRYPDGYHAKPKEPLPFASIASQKNHMAIYLMCVYGDEAEGDWFRNAWAATGKKLDMGKSCVRFKKVEDLALDVLGQAIRRAPVDAYIANYEAATERQRGRKKKGRAMKKKGAGKKKPTQTINKISSAKVKEATGKGWDQWIAFINRNGGADLDHKGVVALLKGKGKLASAWWQQMVTVGYEYASGRRVTGETADAGYQVGVQKVIPMGRRALWELLTSKDGLKLWLGSVRKFSPEPGARYKALRGPGGEIRTVKTGERLRLTYQRPGRDAPTTLQLSLSCPRNTKTRTTLRFHHEKLSSPDEREEMRVHWKGVLEELKEVVT